MKTKAWDYAAILHHPRPRSERHRPVPNAERAIQFAPFVALAGLEDAMDSAAARLLQNLPDAPPEDV